MTPWSAAAQELEPGAYWPLPAGLNIATVVNTFQSGDLAFDPAAPIDEANATINTTALAFTRAFGLAGRSANVGVAVPLIGGHVEGLYLGEPAEVDRFGQGDPRLRLAMNLYGAPAMTPQEFAPTGCRPRRGQRHRRPAAGPVRFREADQPRHQPLVVQAGGRLLAGLRPMGRRSHGRGLALHRQRRLLRRQHAQAGSDCRGRSSISPTGSSARMWLAADANYFTGGRTTIGGRRTSTSSATRASAPRFRRRSVRGHAIRCR